MTTNKLTLMICIGIFQIVNVLQKVGDYMTNVEDIKKELDEVQKTFKAVQKK